MGTGRRRFREQRLARAIEQERGLAASLSPDELARQGYYLVEIAADGGLGRRFDLAGRLFFIPVTPELVGHFEEELDRWLEAAAKGEAAGPDARCPRTREFAEQLTITDSLLNPATWQTVLRRWASRRVRRESGRESYWEKIALDVLESYLAAVER